MFGSLSKAITAALAGIAGAVVAVLAYGAYDAFVDDPYIRKTEQDACTIRTMDAANRAEAAERSRQAASVKVATEAYNAALAAQELARRGVEAKYEAELSSYEQALVEAGRSCPLSVDDLDWLRNQSGAGAGR